MFRAYCGYIGCTVEHFQSILMPLSRFGSLKGLAIAITLCDSDFLVFHDFDDVVVFSSAWYG